MTVIRGRRDQIGAVEIQFLISNSHMLHLCEKKMRFSFIFQEKKPPKEVKLGIP